jgi:valyl-tRNA synthetase
MKAAGPVLQALAKLNEVKVFDSEADWTKAAAAAPVALHAHNFSYFYGLL